jgi:glutaredoxin 3
MPDVVTRRAGAANYDAPAPQEIFMQDNNVASPRVEIYTGPHCGYCFRAKALLARKSLAFREHDVSRPDAYAAMLARLPGARTIPQIFIDGEHIGGCDDLEALDASGGLDSLTRRASAP